MKAKCHKCIHCVGIYRGGRRIICNLNEESMKINLYCEGNMWGMERPVYCALYEKKRSK